MQKLILCYICAIVFVLIGVCNLQHSRSKLIVRDDIWKKYPEKEATRFQTATGVVDILAGVLLAVGSLVAMRNESLYIWVVAAAALFLVVGTRLCSWKLLKTKRKG